MQETLVQSLGQEDPWRRKWQPTAVFLPGKSHGQRSLAGYSPWGHERVGHNLATKYTQQSHMVPKELANVTWPVCYASKGCPRHSRRTHVLFQVNKLGQGILGKESAFRRHEGKSMPSMFRLQWMSDSWRSCRSVSWFPGWSKGAPAAPQKQWGALHYLHTGSQLP